MNWQPTWGSLPLPSSTASWTLIVPLFPGGSALTPGRTAMRRAPQTGARRAPGSDASWTLPFLDIHRWHDALARLGPGGWSYAPGPDPGSFNSTQVADRVQDISGSWGMPMPILVDDRACSS